MQRSSSIPLLFALASSACGSSPDAARVAAGSGGAGGAAGAAGVPSEDAGPDAGPAFPAVPPSLPEAMSGGGPVIATPRVVPVFFAPDALENSITEFFSELAGSDYWKTVTAEYGVGALTVEPAVVETEPPPASITDDEIQAWLGARADGTHPGWPKADANTIFALYYPSSTSIGIHGKTSCQVFDGYHREGQAADGTPLIYAVLARCSPSLEALTVSSSHEIIEAATDPYYYTNPAYAWTDDDHFVWTAATVGEVTDLCEFEPGVNAKLVGGFTVPRSWSNAAAALEHDPCVPPVPGPYFGAQLADEEPMVIQMGSSGIDTRGVRVPVGEERTVNVALFSTAPSEAFELQAYDQSHFFGGPKELELSFDVSSGKNGDRVPLRIKALAPGAYGGSILFLKSKLGSISHVWIGFVAN